MKSMKIIKPFIVLVLCSLVMVRAVNINMVLGTTKPRGGGCGGGGSRPSAPSRPSPPP